MKTISRPLIHYLTCPACKFPVEVYQNQPKIIRCPGCGKTIYLLADLFCGAGGTSTGAERAIKDLGAETILVCINHWPLAIETHHANHPNAMHYIEDITAADPLKLVPWGFLDLLMASPECTHFSRARGGKPVNNQSRMNPWAILTWLTKLDVRTVLIENVPEFRDWGPVDANDQPIREMKGIFFEAWIEAIKKCGYRLEFRILNAADYGDATTRKRFFLIARKDGRPVTFPKPTHNKDGGNGLKKWRAAREIIDWTNPGRSLLDHPKYRKRPLSVNTRRRIAAGFKKQGGVLAPYFINLLDLQADAGGTGWPEGFTIQNRNHGSGRSFDEPVATVTASNGGGGLSKVEPVVTPFVMQMRIGKPGDHRPHSIDEPTITATGHGAGHLVQGKVEPFIMANRSNNVPRGMEEPIHTVTAENMGNLYKVQGKVEPFTFASRFDNTPHDVKDPIPTITNRKLINLVEAKVDPFILGQQSCSAARTPDKPIPTVSTGGAIALVKPEIVVFHGTSNTADVDKPLPCQPTKSKMGLTQPQIVKYYGNEREGLSVDDPLDTVTTKDRFGLVESVIVQTDQTGSNGNCVRLVDKPLATLVTKANTGLAVAEAVMVPVGHGERKGQQPRTHSIDAPTPAMTTKRQLGLAQPAVEQAQVSDIDPRRLVWIDGILYKLDILFRMLANSELAASHSFNDSERLYEFKGTVAEVTKQIGNSVPCGVAAALVGGILR